MESLDFSRFFLLSLAPCCRIYTRWKQARERMREHGQLGIPEKNAFVFCFFWVSSLRFLLLFGILLFLWDFFAVFLDFLGEFEGCPFLILASFPFAWAWNHRQLVVEFGSPTRVFKAGRCLRRVTRGLHVISFAFVGSRKMQLGKAH